MREIMEKPKESLKRKLKVLDDFSVNLIKLEDNNANKGG